MELFCILWIPRQEGWGQSSDTGGCWPVTPFLEKDTPAIKMNPSSLAGSTLLLVKEGLERAGDPWAASSALGCSWGHSSGTKHAVS